MALHICFGHASLGGAPQLVHVAGGVAHVIHVADDALQVVHITGDAP